LVSLSLPLSSIFVLGSLPKSLQTATSTEDEKPKLFEMVECSDVWTFNSKVLEIKLQKIQAVRSECVLSLLVKIIEEAKGKQVEDALEVKEVNKIGKDRPRVGNNWKRALLRHEPQPDKPLSQAASSTEVDQALKNKMRPKVNDSEEAKDDEILGLNRRRSEKFAPIPGIWRRKKLKTFISEVGKLFRVTHRSGRWTKEEDTLDSSEEKHIEQILEVAGETGNLKEEEDDDQENGDESLYSKEEKEIKRILRVARRTGKLGETFRVAQRTGTLEEMLRVAHRTGHLEETLRELQKNGDLREILRVAHRSANVRKNQRVTHRSGILDGILRVAHRTGYLGEEEDDVWNQEIIEDEFDAEDWDYEEANLGGGEDDKEDKEDDDNRIADARGKDKETIDKQEVLDDLMEVLDKHLK